MHRLSFVLIALQFLIGPVGHAVAAPPIDCSNAVATPELNHCAELEFQAADAKLNDAYKLALAFIRKTDAPKPHDAVSWEKALRASQKAWIAFRDADCDGLVPMSWGGGTGTMGAVFGCRMAKTEVRTAELIAIYTEP